MPRALCCLLFLAPIATLLAPPPPASAATRGRTWEPGKRLRLNATIGRVSFLEGLVQETTRPIFNVTGQTDLNARAESFSLEELGVRAGRAARSLARAGRHLPATASSTAVGRTRCVQHAAEPGRSVNARGL